MVIGMRVAGVSSTEREWIARSPKRCVVRPKRTSERRRKRLRRSRRLLLRQLRKLVFLLKLCDFVAHARLGKIKDVREALQLRHAAQHARTINYKFADRVHHAVQSFQRDSYRF